MHATCAHGHNDWKYNGTRRVCAQCNRDNVARYRMKRAAKIRLALGIASDAHFCDKCLGEGKKVMSAGLATFPNSVKCHLCESCARETVGAL